MIKFVPLLLSRIPVFLVSALCVIAQTPADNQQLSVKISTTASSFPAGAKIEVHLDVSNHSDHKIVIPTGSETPEHWGFDFSVTRSDASMIVPVQMTSYLRAAMGPRAPKGSLNEADELFGWVSSAGEETPIAAGSTARFSVVLNNLYVMTTPGVYTISVRKAALIPDEPPSAESNALTITVTDPPPPAISLTLSANGQAFGADSDIDADIIVTNISEAPISLPFDPSHPSAVLNGYKLTALRTDAQSNSPARSKFYYGWRGFDYKYANQVTVQPNETLHYPARINDLIDMSVAGSYTVQAQKVDPVTHLTVKSNSITILVH